MLANNKGKKVINFNLINSTDYFSNSKWLTEKEKKIHQSYITYILTHFPYSHMWLYLSEHKVSTKFQ